MKLAAIIAQLVVLSTIASKFGVEAGLLAIAAIILNAVQAAYNK